MAAGKPVVATDIDGTREAIVHGVSGLLVPAASSEALAAGIGSVLRDAALAQRIGQGAYARSCAEFSLPGMVNQVVSIYEELLGRTGAPGEREYARA
jgi:glycosyltransferase involved in cell wall biosynthesis